MKKIKTALMATLMAITFSTGLTHAYNVTGGEIKSGAVPNAIVYQGRLEKNGSPVSDTDISATTFYFSVFNSQTGGTSSAADCDCNGDTCDASEITKLSENFNLPNHCLWRSAVISTKVVSGLFSLTVNTPWEIFKFTGSKYLEVEVASVRMSPREKIGSVPYALVAKKLEDNSTIRVSSLSVAQDGNIYLNDGCIVFNNAGVESTLCSSTTASAINSIQSTESILLNAGTYIYFNTDNSRRMTILQNGNVGIGTETPSVKLEVNGDLKVNGTVLGNYDTVAIAANNTLKIKKGLITGDSGSINLGNTANALKLNTTDSQNLIVLTSDGRVGIGTASPSQKLDVSGTIVAQSFRGGDITVGGGTSSNEIYTELPNSNLIIQKNSRKNVGIGTDAPEAKLHVIGGVKADSMTVTGTTYLNGNVNITGGRFTANNNLQTEVHLSSTVIHGRLQVLGDISLDAGSPAFLEKENTFTERNTFEDSVVIATDALVYQRLGVGFTNVDTGFKFGGDQYRYLQVGNADGNANVYIVGGSNANSSLDFYRGDTSVARLLAGNNTLSTYIGDNAVAAASPNLYTVNTDFSVNNGAIPVLYVSTGSNYVGIANNTPDGESRLRVDGQVFVRTLKFPDGTTISGRESIGNPTGVNSTDDVVINSNQKILFQLNNISQMSIVDGKIGIKTESPLAALHIASGNVMIGTVASVPAIYSTGNNLIVENGVYSKANIKGNSLYTNDVERITSAGVVKNTTWQGNIIDIAYGGTGTGAISAGPVKSNGTKLISENIDLESEVSGVLPVAHGGTGASTLNAGVVRGNGTNALTIGLVHLNTEVDNVLSVAHGGTNNSSMPSAGVLRSYGAFVSTGAVQLDAAGEVTGILPVPNGGTGLATIQAGALLYGKANSSVGTITVGTGQILVGSGSGAPVSASLEGTNITVAGGNGTLAISIPQSVATTATPEFSGLKLSSLESGWLQTDADGYIVSTPYIDLSNVQGTLSVSKGGTGVNSLSSGVVRGNGTSPLSTGTVHLDSEVDSVLSAANGGTGYSTYDVGDILIANTSNTFSKVKLNSGQILIGSTGQLPQAACITGTANQITVAPAAGSITLSLPQDIHAGAAPTFAGLKLTNLTSGFIKANGANPLTSSAVNLKTEVSGLLPMEKGGTGKTSLPSGIVRSDGVSLSTAPVDLSSSADVLGILSIANGGTGKNNFGASNGIMKYDISGEEGSFSAGKVSLSSETEIDGILPISHGGTNASSIASGPVRSDGTTLSRGAIQLQAENNEVTGVLSVANGGTGHSSFSANKVLYTSAANTISELTLASGNILMADNSGVPYSTTITGNNIGVDTSESGKLKLSLPQNIGTAASPTFAGLTLTGQTSGFLKTNSEGVVTSVATLSLSDFNGILPTANGGTGVGSLPAGVVRANGAIPLSTGAVQLASEVDGVLPVANGGTGNSSWTLNSVMYFSSVGTFSGLLLEPNKIFMGGSDNVPTNVDLLGTANQINVTFDSDKITVSLPQDLHTAATPEFAGIKLALSTNGILKIDNGGHIVSTSTVNIDGGSTEITGILPISKGGTGNSNIPAGPVFSDGVQLSSGTINLENDVVGKLKINNGGTGSVALDLSTPGVVRSNGTSLNSTGKVSLVNDVESQLPVANGGTGQSSFTSNKILYTSATNVISEFNLVSGRILMSDSLGAPVSGILQGANGIVVSPFDDATDTIAIGLEQDLMHDSTPTFSNITLSGMEDGFVYVEDNVLKSTPSISISFITAGTVSVANGGTGWNTLSPNALMVGNNTDPINQMILGVGQIPMGTESGIRPVSIVGYSNIIVTAASDNISIDTVQGITSADTPTFSGLKLSGLSQGILNVASDGSLTSDTLSVAQGGTGVTSFTANSVIYANSATALAGLELTSGKILMGGTDGVPVAGNITGTADEVSVTHNADTITVEIPDAVTLNTVNSTAVSVTNTITLPNNNKSHICASSAGEGSMYYCTDCGASSDPVIVFKDNVGWKTATGTSITCP